MLASSTIGVLTDSMEACVRGMAASFCRHDLGEGINMSALSSSMVIGKFDQSLRRTVLK